MKSCTEVENIHAGLYLNTWDFQNISAYIPKSVLTPFEDAYHDIMITNQAIFSYIR